MFTPMFWFFLSNVYALFFLAFWHWLGPPQTVDQKWLKENFLPCLCSQEGNIQSFTKKYDVETEKDSEKTFYKTQNPFMIKVLGKLGLKSQRHLCLLFSLQIVEF